MSKHTKITHFAELSDIDKYAITNNMPHDQSDLGKLYPTPKTYDQRLKDELERNKIFRRRLPKYPSIQIAVLGSIIFGLAVLFIQSIEQTTEQLRQSDSGMANVMLTVFFSFTLSLAVLGLAFLWVRHVIYMFDVFGGRMRLFWVVYGTILFFIMGAWLSGWLGKSSDAFWIPLLVGVHFIILFLSLRRLLVIVE